MITTRLGAVAFGIFVLVQAFVSLIQNFTDFGVSQVLPRDIAREAENEGGLLSHALGLRLTLGLIAVPVATAIGLITYANKSTTMKIGLVLMVCTIPFAVVQEVSAAHFVAKLRNTILVAGGIAQQIIFVGLVVVAVSLHRSVAYCLGASLVATIISALFTLIMARREIKFSPTYNREIWLSMLRTSTPIGLAFIIGLLYFRADALILSYMSTARQIGYYGVAYSIVSVFLSLPVILSRTFLPRLVNASGDEIQSTVRSTLDYYAIGGTFGATAIIVCGPTVIEIVAGRHFGASVSPLRVLGLGLLFISVSTGLSSVCVARGFSSKLFVVSLISLVINIALNIAVIPEFGIVGSALATLVCEIIATVVFAYLVRKEVEVHSNLVRVLIRPVTAGTLTCVVLAPIYLHRGLSLVSGLALIPTLTILYFLILTVVGGIPNELSAMIRSTVFNRVRRYLRK